VLIGSRHHSVVRQRLALLSRYGMSVAGTRPQMDLHVKGRTQHEARISLIRQLSCMHPPPAAVLNYILNLSIGVYPRMHWGVSEGNG